jgi:hypothetical protein
MVAKRRGGYSAGDAIAKKASIKKYFSWNKNPRSPVSSLAPEGTERVPSFTEGEI